MGAHMIRGDGAICINVTGNLHPACQGQFASYFEVVERATSILNVNGDSHAVLVDDQEKHHSVVHNLNLAVGVHT